jgi:hypothetical protein
MANFLGVYFHIVNSLSSGTTEKEVKSILKIPQNLNIAFPCNLGYTVSPPVKHLRVRRDIKDFTYFNKFGSKNLE